MIRVESATKSYKLDIGGRHYVYRDLNLVLPDKLNVGVIGRNGAGKSTLLRLLSGSDLPDKGRVVATGSVSPPIGIVGGVMQQLSAYDNAKFICQLMGDHGANLQERLRYIEDFCELGEFYRRPIKTYSSGMRGRVGFAIAMAYDFDHFLFDEVGATGDAAFKKRFESVFKYRRGRSSIIMVSHTYAQLKQWCDVGLYVRDGQVLYFDDINKAIEAYQRDTKT